jgi:hypothetical protein
MSTLHAEETDTSCTSTTAGGGEGYTVHTPRALFYTVERDKTSFSIVMVVDRDTPCTLTLLVVDRDTPCTHTLLLVDRDTPCTFTLLVVDRDTPCTFTMMVLDWETPCTFTLLVVDRDTSCTFTLLVVEKETPYKSALWWRKGYICTSKVRTGMPGKQLVRHRHFSVSVLCHAGVGIPASGSVWFH